MHPSVGGKVALVDAGMGDVPRGNLHVILPSNGDQVFGLSEDAIQHLKAAGRSATQFIASPACKLDSKSDRGNVDSRVAISAIIAQVMSLSGEIAEAGMPELP